MRRLPIHLKPWKHGREMSNDALLQTIDPLYTVRHTPTSSVRSRSLSRGGATPAPLPEVPGVPPLPMLSPFPW